MYLDFCLYIYIMKYDITEIKKAQFWSKVSDNGVCWEWTGSKNKHGYGTFRHKLDTLAHRISYQIINGAIENGDHVLHSCDNPSCVNPSHLFSGNHKDNMLDKKTKGRSRRIGRSSHYKGVGIRNDTGKWRAYYMLNGKNRYVGTFDTEMDAVVARELKCKELGLINQLNLI